MVCTPIYYFLAPKGKYLEPATSSHPIEAEGYEIHSDIISLVRELNFVGGLVKIRTSICKTSKKSMPPS
jgi:hypothetical protein